MKKISIFLLYIPILYAMEQNPNLSPTNQTITKKINNKKLVNKILQNIQKEHGLETNRFFISVTDEQALSILNAATKACQNTEFTKNLCEKLRNKSKYFHAALENRIQKIITCLKAIKVNTINHILYNHVIISLPQELTNYCISQAYSQITSFYEIELPKIIKEFDGFIKFCNAKHLAALVDNNYKNLSIFDLTTTQELLQKSFPKSISSLSFNKNGTQLAIANNSKTISLYDSQTLQLLTSINFKHNISAIKFQTRQDVLIGWYYDQYATLKQYMCIPEKNTNQTQYTKPEKIDNTPYTSPPSNIYEINEINEIKNITKKTDHNYALCLYAINNSKKNASLHNIVASSYFNNLTEFEKNYIKQLIAINIKNHQ